MVSKTFLAIWDPDLFLPFIELATCLLISDFYRLKFCYASLFDASSIWSPSSRVNMAQESKSKPESVLYHPAFCRIYPGPFGLWYRLWKTCGLAPCRNSSEQCSNNSESEIFNCRGAKFVEGHHDGPVQWKVCNDYWCSDSSADFRVVIYWYHKRSILQYMFLISEKGTGGPTISISFAFLLHLQQHWGYWSNDLFKSREAFESALCGAGRDRIWWVVGGWPRFGDTVACCWWSHFSVCFDKWRWLQVLLRLELDNVHLGIPFSYHLNTLRYNCAQDILFHHPIFSRF